MSCVAQVSEAFGLPYAGAAMKEAAAKWPVLAGMSKCDGEMCQVRFAEPQAALIIAAAV
jgi:hypothetical protein